MKPISSKSSQAKEEFKKRIKKLESSPKAGLTENYLNSLNLKKLKDLYLITKTMKMKKNF